MFCFCLLFKKPQRCSEKENFRGRRGKEKTLLIKLEEEEGKRSEGILGEVDFKEIKALNACYTVGSATVKGKL